MQIENDGDREHVRGLSHEQIKAKMPEVAQKFFDRNPPLLWAWKYSLLGDRNNQAAIIQEYFTNLRADQQYMLVTELASITQMLVSINYADRELKRVIHNSKQVDSQRFQAFGVNFHLNYKDAALVFRALRDQLVFIKRELNATEDFEVRTSLLDEVRANKSAMDSMRAQVERLYPSIKQP
jgi:hypothetical protein